MDRAVKRVYQVLILLGVCVLLFVLALASPVIYNDEDFSMYNPGWNGCSRLAVKTYKTGKLQPTYFVKDSELTIGQKSFTEYSLVANRSVIIIIGPQSDYTKAEADYVRNFLKNGGLLFIADDFGRANSLLSKINSSSRFTNKLLLDLSFEKKASFVTVYNFENKTHPLLFNVTSILFNYPSSIKKGENSQVLAYSSEISWLDDNTNYKKDEKEVNKPYPVLVEEEYGDGKIILFSGPSLLINSMEDKLDNQQFRENIMGYILGDRSKVIIDESHRDLDTPYNLAYFMPSSIGNNFKMGIVFVVVVLFVFAFTNIPRKFWRKTIKIFLRKQENTEIKTNEAIIKNLLEKHPGWSKKKLEEIIKGYEYE